MLMECGDYLRLLAEDIHTVAVATVGADGRPKLRAIDIMLWDEDGVYFLTARGKSFYAELVDQGFIALTGIKGKISVSLRGEVQDIGGERLDEIFEKNPYMKEIYPGRTREALTVFRLSKAVGEYFDISVPSRVRRDSFTIGGARAVETGYFVGGAGASETGYFVGSGCIGCGRCLRACPQRCIDLSSGRALIDQKRCLHCGRCATACPSRVIERRGIA